MIEDIQLVVWKEYRELLQGRNNMRKLLAKLLAPLILAAVFPITWGPEWVNEFPALLIAIIIPALLVGVMIPDSFAGERERHTLDTLLASRLPDNAILIGKMVIPILVSWLAALLFTFLSLVVVNLAHFNGKLLVYSPANLFGIPSLSLISATLMTGGGILTSMTAESVQEATQKLMTFVLVPAMALQIVPMLFQKQILALLKVIDGPQLLGLVTAILAAADMGISLLAFRKFQRSKMYLD